MRRVGSGCLEMAVARQRAAAREMTHSSWRRAAEKGWARAGFRRCEIGPEAGPDRRRVFPWSTLFLEPGHAICLGLVTPFILAGFVSVCVSGCVGLWFSPFSVSVSLSLSLSFSLSFSLCLCLSLSPPLSLSLTPRAVCRSVVLCPPPPSLL